MFVIFMLLSTTCVGGIMFFWSHCAVRLICVGPGLHWDGWPCPGSVSGAGHLFRYGTNQPPKASSAFHPSGIGKWVPTSAGKAKAGMVHSVSGCMRGDLLRTCAIPHHLRGVFTTTCYANPRLLLPLPLPAVCSSIDHLSIVLLSVSVR